MLSTLQRAAEAAPMKRGTRDHTHRGFLFPFSSARMGLLADCFIPAPTTVPGTQKPPSKCPLLMGGGVDEGRASRTYKDNQDEAARDAGEKPGGSAAKEASVSRSNLWSWRSRRIKPSRHPRDFVTHALSPSLP